MPYRYLEDIAIADAAFEAWGADPEEMFRSSADALLNVMVDDPAAVRPAEEIRVTLRSDDSELLLFSFLNELVFLKDSRQLLLRAVSVEFPRGADGTSLRAVLKGERIDAQRHPLLADVKAVTLHRYRVEKNGDGWRAVVVLDI